MTDNSRSPVPCVQILRLPQVCKATGLGRSMIYQLESQRRFPCRVRIGARAVGWVEAEVQSWLAGRIERHRASGSRLAPPMASALDSPRRESGESATRNAQSKRPADSQMILFGSCQQSERPDK